MAWFGLKALTVWSASIPLKHVYCKMGGANREREIRDGREKDCLMEGDPEGGRRDEGQGRGLLTIGTEVSELR